MGTEANRPLEPRLNLTGAAEYGGWTVRQVRRWCEEGKLPHYKPGKSLEFTKSDLDAFLAASRREATAGPLAAKGA